MTNQAYRYSSRRIAGKALETDCQSRENLATLSGVLAYKALHQKRPNQMLLQPPGTYAHYGQACRTHHSTEPSYEPPLYHYHPTAFLCTPSPPIAPWPITSCASCT